ncbi:MAG: hypothetical protein NTZ56_11485 [Acidobacteria bacterium]|nr:hypothetical protein [Acidobacteriota bacterium]
MDGQQILVLTVGPISTLVIVMVGVLLNNNRLASLESSVNARFASMESHFNSRLGSMETQFNTRLNDMRDVLRAEMAKNHSELLMKFAELDHRISRLEDHPAS